MSGKVPIVFVMFILFRDRADICRAKSLVFYSSSAISNAFLGTFPYPKIPKFLAAHSDCRRFLQIATFLKFHIPKRSLAPPTGFTRYNTPPNSKSLQILHICTYIWLVFSVGFVFGSVWLFFSPRKVFLYFCVLYKIATGTTNVRLENFAAI